MNTFVDELRRAHAIMKAYNRGAHTSAQLALATGLPAHICVEWMRALRLPSEAPRRPFRPAKKPQPHFGLKFDI